MSISHWGMFFGWMECRDQGGGYGIAVWVPKHADDMFGMW